MLDIYSRINHLVDVNGMTGKQLGSQLGLKKSPLTDWKNGKSYPTINQIMQLCDIFAVSSDYLLFGKTNNQNLSKDEIELLENYKILDSRGRYRLHTIMYEEMDRVEYNKLNSSRRYISIPILDYTVVGGSISAIENVLDYTTTDTNADYALYANGTIMDPIILENELIYVKKTSIIDDGKIAIIMIDSDVTCKRIKKYSDKIELLSFNKVQSPLTITSTDLKDVQIIGEVILSDKQKKRMQNFFK